MKSIQGLLVSSLTIAGFLLAGTLAKADPLSVVFTPEAFQTGIGGETLTFDVDVTNISSSEIVNFNSDSLNINPAGNDLVTNDEFFANSPTSLNPGDSYEYEAFTVFIPAGTPIGLYEGSYEILGGPTYSDFGVVGSANFDVNLTPEPTSFLLLGTGLLALAVIARRKIVSHF